MITLSMTGWKVGLKTVTLIELIKGYSTGSLKSAKMAAEQLLDGETVELNFKTDTEKEEFRNKAEAIGVIF